MLKSFRKTEQLIHRWEKKITSLNRNYAWFLESSLKKDSSHLDDSLQRVHHGMPANSGSARKQDRNTKASPYSIESVQPSRKFQAMLKLSLECDLARLCDKTTIVLAQAMTQ